MRICGKDRPSAQQSSTGYQMKQEICPGEMGKWGREATIVINVRIPWLQERESKPAPRRRDAESLRFLQGGLDGISPPGLVKRDSTAYPGVAFLNSLAY